MFLMNYSYCRGDIEPHHSDPSICSINGLLSLCHTIKADLPIIPCMTEVPLAIGLWMASASVILLRCPFNAMLCLILTFFLVSGLCLIFGCEFLSLLLIFVYVGSISILFLFAAMFLDLWAFRLCDVNLASTFFCAVLQGNLLPLYCNWFCNWFTYSVSSLIWAVNGSSLNQCLQHYHFQWIDLYSAKSNHSNIYALCLFLYSDYYLPFILAAYQLLISMFAAHNEIQDDIKWEMELVKHKLVILDSNLSLE
jgi:NADH:ubiquinone oxidoreductase subunit 6 (subunit J)